MKRRQTTQEVYTKGSNAAVITMVLCLFSIWWTSVIFVVLWLPDANRVSVE